MLITLQEKNSKMLKKKELNFDQNWSKKCSKIDGEKVKKNQFFPFFLWNFFSKIKNFSSKTFSTNGSLPSDKTWQVNSFQNIDQQNFLITKQFFSKKSQLGWHHCPSIPFFTSSNGIWKTFFFDKFSKFLVTFSCCFQMAKKCVSVGCSSDKTLPETFAGCFTSKECPESFSWAGNFWKYDFHKTCIAFERTGKYENKFNHFLKKNDAHKCPLPSRKWKIVLFFWKNLSKNWKKWSKLAKKLNKKRKKIIILCKNYSVNWKKHFFWKPDSRRWWAKKCYIYGFFLKFDES